MTSVYLNCEGTVELKSGDKQQVIEELQVFGNKAKSPNGVNEYFVKSTTGSLLLEIELYKCKNFILLNEENGEELWNLFIKEFSWKNERQDVFRRSLSTVSRFSSAQLSITTKNEFFNRYLEEIVQLVKHSNFLRNLVVGDLFFAKKKLHTLLSIYTNLMQEKVKKLK